MHKREKSTPKRSTHDTSTTLKSFAHSLSFLTKKPNILREREGNASRSSVHRYIQWTGDMIERVIKCTTRETIHRREIRTAHRSQLKVKQKYKHSTWSHRSLHTHSKESHANTTEESSNWQCSLLIYKHCTQFLK